MNWFAIMAKVVRQCNEFICSCGRSHSQLCLDTLERKPGRPYQRSGRGDLPLWAADRPVSAVRLRKSKERLTDRLRGTSVARRHSK